MVFGSLYWGYVYGFIFQDFVVWFIWMCGDEVYFLFGYDDNGIVLEFLIEDEFGIKYQDYE